MSHTLTVILTNSVWHGSIICQYIILDHDHNVQVWHDNVTFSMTDDHHHHLQLQVHLRSFLPPSFVVMYMSWKSRVFTKVASFKSELYACYLYTHVYVIWVCITYVSTARKDPNSIWIIVLRFFLFLYAYINTLYVW